MCLQKMQHGLDEHSRGARQESHYTLDARFEFSAGPSPAMAAHSLGRQDGNGIRVHAQKNAFYTKDDRQALLASSVPQTVWIGRHSHSNIVDGGSNRLDPSPARSNPLAESYVTTLALSRLILQVFTIRFKPEFEHTPLRLTLHLKPGPWDRGLIQIWPTLSARVAWPRRLVSVILAQALNNCARGL
jgi:hypothetical protein